MIINQLLWQGACKLKESFVHLFNQMEGKTLLVGGGSGFIGSMLIGTLLCNVENLKIIVFSRNRKKALERFEYLGVLREDLIIIENFWECSYSVDYVINCASPTQSQYFADYPVETIDSIYQCTKDLLEFAIKNRSKKFIFLSTMEVYGESEKKYVCEEDLGVLCVSNPRNSYPAAKLLCEHLVMAYGMQYSFDICILRLSQVIGACVSRDDERVYMAFLKEALEKGSITLLTAGETKRNYIDIFDSISGILFGLLDSNSKSVYNLANPNIFISVLELAKEIAREVSVQRNVEILIQYDKNRDTRAFLPFFERGLDTSKIEALGWRAIFGIRERIRSMSMGVSCLVDTHKEN
ncbi:MAG: NAD(P)-dependent oxidoreductase [Helicobacter sp.]|nr:NAD(P)-dependent oxidoreductase [Helicobacter sp.]